MAKKKVAINPQLNPKLQGFDIRINSLGEIVPNMDLSRLNEFLDEHVPDKKLVDRPDHANRRPDVAPEPALTVNRSNYSKIQSEPSPSAGVRGGRMQRKGASSDSAPIVTPGDDSGLQPEAPPVHTSE